MEFSFEQEVAAARPRVELAYVSASFYEALGGLPNLGVREVLECRREGSVTTLRVRLAFTGQVSGPARAIVDASKLTWVTTTTMTEGTHRSAFELLPDFYRDQVSCAGTYRFDELDQTTRITMAGDLTVKVPFFGRTAEEAIADGFRQNLAGQAAVLQTWEP